MHLVVDSNISSFDHEGSLDTPGVVPGVVAEPVVHSAGSVSSPSDNLDGVATKSFTGGGGVVVPDTTGVSLEGCVHGEGTSDGSVSHNIFHNGFNGV